LYREHAQSRRRREHRSAQRDPSTYSRELGNYHDRLDRIASHWVQLKVTDTKGDQASGAVRSPQPWNVQEIEQKRPTVTTTQKGFSQLQCLTMFVHRLSSSNVLVIFMNEISASNSCPIAFNFYSVSIGISTSLLPAQTQFWEGWFLLANVQIFIDFLFTSTQYSPPARVDGRAIPCPWILVLCLETRLRSALNWTQLNLAELSPRDFISLGDPGGYKWIANSWLSLCVDWLP
jgi:hypothetical protein